MTHRNFDRSRKRRPGSSLDLTDLYLNGRVTDPTMYAIRHLARELGVDIPRRQDMTQGEALEILGYLEDLESGAR